MPAITNTYAATIYNENTIAAFGSILYGVCNTQTSGSGSGVLTKSATLDYFDRVVPGVTVYIKFTRGVLESSNLTLKVGNSNMYPIIGNCMCSAGSVIAFTFDGDSNAWRVVTTGLTEAVKDYIRSQIEDLPEIIDEKVKQTPTTENQELYILLKKDDNVTEVTDGVKFSRNLSNLVTVNPAYGTITAPGGFIGKADSATTADSADSIEWTNINNIPSIFIAGEELNLSNGNISAATLREALGLSRVLRFIGVTTVDIESGNQINPDIDGYTYSQRMPGDVVINNNNHREYVVDLNGRWEVLGQDDLSDEYEVTTSGNTWIASITQRTDRSILVTTRTLDTTGEWLGNAATATSFATDQIAYVDLTLNSTSTYIRGGEQSNILGVNGILPVTSGGTGSDGSNLDRGGVIYAKTVTEYDSTAAGDDGQILISQGTNSPIWTETATLECNTANNTSKAYTTLTLGNSNRLTQQNHSEGKISLYSSDSGYHEIVGREHSTVYTHELINSSGQLIQIEQDIVSNRLYYSTSTPGTFEDSNHYVNNNKISINSPSAPSANITLYVNGTAEIATNLDVDTNLTVSGTSTLTGNVGIGTVPSTGNNSYLLTVDGTSYFNDDIHLNGIFNILDDTESTAYDNGAVVIAGGVGIAKNLNIHGKVGLGTNIESNYIVAIGGSIIIENNSGTAAELLVNTSNNITSLTFVPTTTNTGFIGTTSMKWNSGYFSDLLSIGSNTAGIELEHLQAQDKITLLSPTTEIQLSTTNNHLSIEASTPTIILTTTTLGASAWAIINDNGDLSINNQKTIPIELLGTDSGFEIYNRLYINTSIPSSNLVNFYVEGISQFSDSIGIGIAPETSNNSHILTIAGSTLITTNSTSAAHLDLVTDSSTHSPTLSFFPETTHTGSLGITGQVWKELYLSNLIDITDNNSSIVLNVLDSGNTHTGQITITTTIPTIALSTLTSGQSTWAIYNENGSIYIDNQRQANTIIFKGSDYGFKIAGCLYINENIPAQNTFDLYVNGQTELLDQVGIGAEPADNTHILTINGSTIILDGNNEVAYLELATETNTSILKFYPETSEMGYIGLSTNRWKYGYFSHHLEVGSDLTGDNIGIYMDATGSFEILNSLSTFTVLSKTISNHDQTSVTLVADTASIELLTTDNDEAAITMLGDIPIITLSSSNYNSEANWEIKNNQGYFSINNQKTSTNLREIHGADNGFYILNRLYINSIITANDDPEFTLQVNGNSNFIGHLLPNATNTYDLGASSNDGEDTPYRWRSVLIGTADTYGDPFLPVYWLNGVPTYTYGVVQQKSFTFSSGDTSTTLTHAAYHQKYGIHTFVIQIVVTSGESNLNAPITWSSTNEDSTTGTITLSTSVAVSGTVSGYIITARGVDLDSTFPRYDPTETPYTPPTPPPPTPSLAEPEPGSESEP